jgi:hypothetical protein
MANDRVERVALEDAHDRWPLGIGSGWGKYRRAIALAHCLSWLQRARLAHRERAALRIAANGNVKCAPHLRG